MHNRPIVTCSPVDTTTSLLARIGFGLDLLGESDESVGFSAHCRNHDNQLMARGLKAAILPATALIRSVVPTEVPPNFCTISAIPPS